MYTILMDSDKNLITTNKVKIYQRENLVDKIQFLLPQTYKGLDLSKFTIKMKYIDQVNLPRSLTLEQSEELFCDKIVCVLPVNSNLTLYAGTITLHLELTCSDAEFRTGETTLEIIPVNPCHFNDGSASLGQVELVLDKEKNSIYIMQDGQTVSNELSVDELSELIGDNSCDGTMTVIL